MYTLPTSLSSPPPPPPKLARQRNKLFPPTRHNGGSLLLSSSSSSQLLLLPHPSLSPIRRISSYTLSYKRWDNAASPKSATMPRRPRRMSEDDDVGLLDSVGARQRSFTASLSTRSCSTTRTMTGHVTDDKTDQQQAPPPLPPPPPPPQFVRRKTPDLGLLALSSKKPIHASSRFFGKASSTTTTTTAQSASATAVASTAVTLFSGHAAYRRSTVGAPGAAANAGESAGRILATRRRGQPPQVFCFL